MNESVGLCEWQRLLAKQQLRQPSNSSRRMHFFWYDVLNVDMLSWMLIFFLFCFALFFFLYLWFFRSSSILLFFLCFSMCVFICLEHCYRIWWPIMDTFNKFWFDAKRFSSCIVLIDVCEWYVHCYLICCPMTRTCTRKFSHGNRYCVQYTHTQTHACEAVISRVQSLSCQEANSIDSKVFRVWLIFSSWFASWWLPLRFKCHFGQQTKPEMRRFCQNQFSTKIEICEILAKTDHYEI